MGLWIWNWTETQTPSPGFWELEGGDSLRLRPKLLFRLSPTSFDIIVVVSLPSLGWLFWHSTETRVASKIWSRFQMNLTYFLTSLNIFVNVGIKITSFFYKKKNKFLFIKSFVPPFADNFRSTLRHRHPCQHIVAYFAAHFMANSPAALFAGASGGSCCPGARFIGISIVDFWRCQQPGLRPGRRTTWMPHPPQPLVRPLYDLFMRLSIMIQRRLCYAISIHIHMLTRLPSKSSSCFCLFWAFEPIIRPTTTHTVDVIYHIAPRSPDGEQLKWKGQNRTGRKLGREAAIPKFWEVFASPTPVGPAAQSPKSLTKLHLPDICLGCTYPGCRNDIEFHPAPGPTAAQWRSAHRSVPRPRDYRLRPTPGICPRLDALDGPCGYRKYFPCGLFMNLIQQTASAGCTWFHLWFGWRLTIKMVLLGK